MHDKNWSVARLAFFFYCLCSNLQTVHDDCDHFSGWVTRGICSDSGQTERVPLDEPSTWQWDSLTSLFNLIQLHRQGPSEKTNGT